MPTASSVRAEKFWPAVPERIWDSIREEFTLPAAAELEAHFQALGDPEAMQRAVRVFLSGLRRLDLRNSTSLGSTQKMRALRRSPPTVFV